jgi:hypothetical protein
MAVTGQRIVWRIRWPNTGGGGMASTAAPSRSGARAGAYRAAFIQTRSALAGRRGQTRGGPTIGGNPRAVGRNRRYGTARSTAQLSAFPSNVDDPKDSGPVRADDRADIAAEAMLSTPSATGPDRKTPALRVAIIRIEQDGLVGELANTHPELTAVAFATVSECVGFSADPDVVLLHIRQGASTQIALEDIEQIALRIPWCPRHGRHCSMNHHRFSQRRRHSLRTSRETAATTGTFHSEMRFPVGLGWERLCISYAKCQS